MLDRKNLPNLMGGRNGKKRSMLMTLTILAIILVILGIVMIVLWIAGGGFSFSLFSRRPTPTSTMPPTPVMSPTASLIPTQTFTPEPTITTTPSGPFEYEVQEDDSCWVIAENFDVDFLTLLAINNFEDGTCPIIPGMKILIPAPGQSLPTPTDVPADMKSGTKISYTVQSGDTLASIASKFNTTVEDILAQNKNVIEDQDNIGVGIVLTIRVNLVTPTPTFAPTSTLAQ
ncbi:MAG TPA: LysM peptidoglycan-binding domain-containing protein [Anaerolineaceae bacterium]|nr:LysM peptidoglycan-binding domain-containing protein [Anaerolineaceae bacterium]